MTRPNDFYKKNHERIIAYFDHVSWCGVKDVRAFIEDWMQSTQAAQSTWYHRITDLKALHKYMVERDETPTKTSILQYYEIMRERGVRESAIRAVHIRIKSFFDYLSENDVYPDIMRGIHLKTPEYRERMCLNARETQMLLTRITDIRDKTIVSLMVFCGLRCVEVSEMQWGDIDGDHLMVRGKCRTDKSTVVVLPISVQKLLRELKAMTHGENGDEDYVFVSEKRHDHRQLSPMCVSKLVRYILHTKMPEKKGLTPHCLRHTAITLAIESGMDIHRVSRFARHKSIATTSVYLHDLERFSDPVESHIEALVNHQSKSDELGDLLKQALLKLLKS